MKFWLRKTVNEPKKKPLASAVGLGRFPPGLHSRVPPTGFADALFVFFYSLCDLIVWLILSSPRKYHITTENQSDQAWLNILQTKPDFDQSFKLNLFQQTLFSSREDQNSEGTRAILMV